VSIDIRRHALLRSALTAMVRARWSAEVADGAQDQPALFGAALIGRLGGEVAAWTLDQEGARLGAALRLAQRAGATRLHLCVAPEPGGTAGGAAGAARQAGQFRLSTTVWRHTDGALHEVTPSPSPSPGLPSPEELALVGALEASGADTVVEDGVLRAEVLGLEVGRVVTPEWSPGPVIQVGVGHHDREARAIVHPDAAPTDSLADVVATVRGLRRAGAPSHPANLLAPERWLRAVVMADPGLVGTAQLRPRPSPVSRADLRRRAPAPAAGTDLDGHPVVVVCSVGVDPELIPAAADARLTEATQQGLAPEAVELIVVVPEGDDYPLTVDLAGLLRHPARVVTVGRDWRRQ
jgi:hypothetical protein